MSTRASREIALRAPAKVNLLLEVTDRRADGYHEIDSIFLPVDLCDEVRVRVALGPPGAIAVRCDDPAVPVDRRNTVWRAVEELYRDDPAAAPAVAIELVKRIPAGAGLGGGSSDAGAVLRALARLEGLDPRSARVAAAAVRVGADVPFFLVGAPARVRGIGDVVEPIPPQAIDSLLLVWPGFAVETRSAYAALDRALTWPRPADRIRRFLSGARGPAEVHNDFEAVVGRSHPEIFELKRRILSLGAEAASLTGSGSALFGIFGAAADCSSAAARLRGEGLWAVAARRLQPGPE